MALIRFFILVALLFGSYSAGASLCAELSACPAAAMSDDGCCGGTDDGGGCADTGCEACTAHSALATNLPNVLARPAATPDMAAANFVARSASFPSFRPPDFPA